jgi:large subunit ribosomal protein L11
MQKKYKHKHKIVIKIQSQNAESGPPLSTILGNLGINTVKFCKDFNEYTKDLPNYFQLIVTINIQDNKEYTFFTKMPTTGFIISLLKFEKKYETENGYFFKECVDPYDLLELSKLKFPTMPLEKSFKIILGSLNSTGLYLEKKNNY